MNIVTQNQKPTSEWTDKDWTKFRNWLVGMLQVSPVEVTFTKKDGSERVMKCTTKDELIPQVVEESLTPKREKKTNEEVMSVYDLEAAGWRSFRWDSIKQVSFMLGEE